MKISIIGRSELLYNTALLLREAGHDIDCILTAKEAPEYSRKAKDFKDLAANWQIPFLEGSRIKKHSDFLRDLKSDIAVSINYTGVFPQSVIDLFPLGVLNAHGGDLPRYRGNACQAWAILNGEEKIGLCVHKMIGGELDSGDIITRDYLPIDHNSKVTQVWRWMVERIPFLMKDAIDKLDVNPDYVLERQSQNHKEALRCYPRNPDDGRIDWNKPAIDVLRLINASNKPYAGAFCDFDGMKMIIWDAKLVEDDEHYSAVPGQVTMIEDGFIDIACGKEKLRLLNVEYKGEVNTPDLFIKSIRKRLI